MKIISTIESLENFAERSTKDWEMRTRLSSFLNSVINNEVLSGMQIKEIRDISEYYELELVLEKLKNL